jgi:hypothetical protein
MAMLSVSARKISLALLFGMSAIDISTFNTFAPSKPLDLIPADRGFLV